MKKTDLVIVCPAKFGGWVLKNPLVMNIFNERNGVAELTVTNGSGCNMVFFTTKPDEALMHFARLISANKTGCVMLNEWMKDLVVPRAAYFGHEEDEE